MEQPSVDLMDYYMAEGKEKMQVRKSAYFEEDKMVMESDELMVSMMVSL